MVRRYQTYPEYKSSGVEWIGDVPETWEIWKIAHAFKEVGSGTTPPSSSDEWYEGDVPWVTTGELRESTILDTSKKLKRRTLEQFPTLKIYPKGSVAIAMYGATIGRLGIFGVEATTNQACCVMTSSDVISNKYLYYWLQAFREDIVRLSSGGGQPNINQEKVAALKISAPKISHQDQIANFLDHETAKIDTLIDKQQQLIKLLKEKRQAVISHAVTKGLNPDATMKDSGVEWLGEVPEGWIVSQFKYQTLEMQTGPFGSQLHAEDYVENEIPLINPAHIVGGQIIPSPSCTVDERTQERLSRHKLKEGDLLLARRGELGRCAVIEPEHVGWLCGTGSLKATLHDSLRSHYAYMLISSKGVKVELSLESKGSTMENLNTETLGKIRLPVPPVIEQDEILKFVSMIDLKYVRLNGLAVEQIVLLQERRTALISAAVTGKIDVRNWQPAQTKIPLEASA